MSNEHKPLSERVRGCAYIVPDPHPTDTEAGEREVLGLNYVADEIANLAQRLAEAESWRGQIDVFVRRIVDEVNCGKACGGLDWDQNNPQSTTQVVLDGIKAHTQAAIDDETQNPWKAAIIDELIVDCIYLKEHESDPRRALAEAIAWNVKVALDPTVSKEARDMQQAAIDAALESIEDALNAEGRYDSADLVRSRKGANPLAERAAEYARGIEFRAGQLAEAQAMIAELESLLAEAYADADDVLRPQIAGLERELAETRKDAERWKCARIDPRVAAIYCQSSMAPAFKVDKAIDAAMRQEGE